MPSREANASRERDILAHKRHYDSTDDDTSEEIFEKTPQKGGEKRKEKRRTKTTRLLDSDPPSAREHQAGYGGSTSSREDALRPLAPASFRPDITVGQDEDGNSKVQMDYETWKRVREFVVLADKYVEEHFKFRLARAKTAKMYRDRLNKDKNVGQAVSRGKDGHKGPGVN
jgi:hypothetical protein